MGRKSSVSVLSAKGKGGQTASQAESTAKDLPVLSFATARAWSEWLATHHATLIAAGTMAAPGLAEVERAKRDGRWDRAYDGARSSSVPADLVAAFARNARARAFFETLDAANRYAILYRVQTARKPETRAERITRFVALCERHKTIHPRRQTKSGARSRGASKKARTKE